MADQFPDQFSSNTLPGIAGLSTPLNSDPPIPDQPRPIPRPIIGSCPDQLSPLPDQF